MIDTRFWLKLQRRRDEIRKQRAESDRTRYSDLVVTALGIGFDRGWSAALAAIEEQVATEGAGRVFDRAEGLAKE